MYCAHRFCESGNQTEHSGDGFILLHDIWDTGKVGDDFSLGIWNHLEGFSITCLTANTGYHVGPSTKLWTDTTFCLSRWPGGSWVSYNAVQAPESIPQLTRRKLSFHDTASENTVSLLSPPIGYRCVTVLFRFKERELNFPCR